MNAIYYKVNRKGQYTNYMSGTFDEMQDASQDLISRATAKGYRLIKRAFGDGGVFMTYSDGRQTVELVYVDSKEDVEWLRFFDKCKANRS